MSTELVRYQVGELETIAERVAKSNLFGMTRDQAFTLLLVAESEGMHPIAALRRFHIIEGRPSMRADAMQAEFQRSGGRVEWLESDADKCVAIFSHKEYAPKGFRVSVTLKEMTDAGITKGREGIKKNWKQFPRQMLRARCISEGVRAVNPSVVVGIYTPEEVSDFDNKPVQATAKLAEPPAPTPTPSLPAAAEPPANGNGHAEGPSVTAILSDLAFKVNDSFLNWCIKEGCENPERSLVKPQQIENHMGSLAVDTGKIQASHIEGPDGKRNRTKLLKLLNGWHKKYPDAFMDEVNKYIDKKAQERAAELSLFWPTEDEASGAEAVAEGREPGSDDQ